MNKDLSVNLVCVCMRSGQEIWLEAERAKNVQGLLLGLTTHKFVKLDNQTLNTADIAGIFTAEQMDEYHKLRRGMWKCKYNEWHPKNQTCECAQALRYKTR